MAHKFQSTLDLLTAVVTGLPTAFPQDQRTRIEAELTAIGKNAEISKEALDAAVVKIGKDIWPYKEAYEEFYRRHGEAKEREAMRAKLPEPARVTFDQFITEGGKVEDVRGGARFETFFNEDARAQIVAAELDAHDAVQEEVATFIKGEGAVEFAQLLEEHKVTLTAIEVKIGELRKLSERSEKWASEMQDKANTFEQGFAYVERSPSLEDVQKEVQYYLDILELGQ
jgi:hypothetical protein